MSECFITYTKFINNYKPYNQLVSTEAVTEEQALEQFNNFRKNLEPTAEIKHIELIIE